MADFNPAKYLAEKSMLVNGFDLGQAPDDGALYGQGKFRDTGRRSANGAEALDSVVGAPVRAGIHALTDPNGPQPRDMFDYGPRALNAAKAFLSQMGQDPRSAPTGYDIASKDMGINNPYLGAGVATLGDLAQLPIPGSFMPGIAGEIKGVKSLGSLADASEAFAARAKAAPTVENRIAQMYGETGQVRDAMGTLVRRAEMEHQVAQRYGQSMDDPRAKLNRNSAYDNPRNAPPRVEGVPTKQAPPDSRESFSPPKSYISPGNENIYYPRDGMRGAGKSSDPSGDIPFWHDVNDHSYTDDAKHELDSLVTRFGDDGPHIEKALKKISNTEGIDHLPYVGESVHGKSQAAMPLPNYDAKPTGVIGENRIQGMSKGAADPFAWMDDKYKAGKQLLERHDSLGMPAQINTSSDLISKPDYIAAIPNGSTVNLHMLTGNSQMDRVLFPGNASQKRLEAAAERLKEAGIDVNKIYPQSGDDVIKAAEQAYGQDVRKSTGFGTKKALAIELDDQLAQSAAERNKGPRLVEGQAPNLLNAPAGAASAINAGRKPDSVDAPFDPAKYIQEKGGGKAFDPAAYLRGKGQMPEDPDTGGVLGAVKRADDGMLEFAARSHNPAMVALNLARNNPIGQKAVGYLGGLGRTALATATGQAGTEDWKNAAMGNAPRSADFYKRAGVPEGPSVDVPLAKTLIGHDAKVSARDALGFVTDILSDPLSYAAAKAVHGPATDAAEFTRDLPAKAKKLAQDFSIPEKEAADRIREAARRLSIEPTAGMTKDSEVLQGLESSLHQAPTLGGALMRRETGQVAKGLNQGAKDVLSDASALSPFEAGEQAKGQISGTVNRKFKDSINTFNDLSNYTKNIPSTDRSIQAVSRNIMNIPEVQTFDLPVARQVVKALEKNPSADQIKQIRTMVGSKAESAIDGSERSALWQIYGKLGSLEENTIKRGIISSGRDFGRGASGEKTSITEGMLGQLRGAKKSYAAQMGNIKEVAQNARLGKVNNPSSFISKIDSIRSEDIPDKLMNISDTRLAESVKANFPDAYSTIRSAKIGALANKVTDATGEVSPEKLLGATKGMSQEAKKNLLHTNATTLDDMRTVNDSLPDKVGPSGTPKGLDYMGILNPITQVRDLGRYALYKGMSSDVLQNVAHAVSKMPEARALAVKNPKLFNAVVYEMAQKAHESSAAAVPKAADQPTKGKDKWVQDGLQKLEEHGADAKTLDKAKGAMNDPATKKLLIAASDLKPNTKAMEALIAKLKAKDGR